MATFKTEIQNKRADGTYNVRIRLTHKKKKQPKWQKAPEAYI
jgi:hypothetical protein